MDMLSAYIEVYEVPQNASIIVSCWYVFFDFWGIYKNTLHRELISSKTFKSVPVPYVSTSSNFHLNIVH